MIKWFNLGVMTIFFNVAIVNGVKAEEVQLQCHIHVDRLFKQCTDKHPKKMKLCKHMMKAHQHRCNPIYS
jgi:hypothetical protein